MKLYHGSNIEVANPIAKNRYKTMDFGEGFYTTTNQKQAEEFANKVILRRFQETDKNPIVSVYEFNDDHLANLNTLKFDSPDEKWLNFVVENRKNGRTINSYDLIIGPVANDDVFTTIELFEAGEIDKKAAIARFKVKELFNQYVFCNTNALSCLKFANSYVAEDK